LSILSQEMPFVEAVAKAEGNDINLFFACPEPVEGNDPGSKVQVNLLNSFNLDFSKYKKIGIDYFNNRSLDTKFYSRFSINKPNINPLLISTIHTIVYCKNPISKN